MLGSRQEADDAVQEAWLKASRADSDDLDNVAARLTTIVSRTCLDRLRARRARPEDPADLVEAPAAGDREDGEGPEQAAVIAD